MNFGVSTVPEADLPDSTERAIAELVAAAHELESRLVEHRSWARELPEAERRRHASAVRQIRDQRDRAVRGAIERRDAQVTAAQGRYGRHMDRMRAQRDDAIGKIHDLGETQLETAQSKLERALWLAETVFESGEHGPREQYERIKSSLHDAVADVRTAVAGIESLAARAAQRSALRVRNQADPDDDRPGTATDTVASAVAAAESAHVSLQRARILRIARPPVLVAASAVACAAGAAIGFLSTGVRSGALPAAESRALAHALAGGAIAGLAAATSAALIWWRAGVSVRRSAMVAYASRRTIDAFVKSALQDALSARQIHERRRARERESSIARAKAKWEPVIARVRHRQDSLTSELKAKYASVERQLEVARDSDISAAEQECVSALDSAKRVHDDLHAEEVANHTATMNSLAHEDERLRTATASFWRAAMARWQSAGARLRTSLAAEHPPWDDPLWRTEGQSYATANRPGAPLGMVRIALASIAGATHADADLAWPADTCLEPELPISLSLPERGSLLVESDLEGRAAGIAILNQAVLRLLTSLPPGKVQFLLIDPVGMGESFAGLMHLADESNAIIGNRIWSEARHVEQRLADLSEHLETVIQKYLRDEFASLDEYNRRAGEIAEPYRFVVMADFPTSLTEEAARRLSAIAAGGARCGVHTLILRDTRQPDASGCDLAMVRERSVCISRQSGQWIASTPLLAGLRFEPSPMPAGPAAIDLVKRIGKRAAESTRVEVPFSSIAPGGDALWTESSARRLSVPLGRAGATRLQRMVLGEGTQQHALIAGRTGSGKSTLLHALVTNLALHYSPDEVEMWLIDFKKGVEFRTYATHRLPHARVVAIESDREFGISVLQGLDAELRRRGDLFRAAGVQDLAGYRAARQGDPMPRALLIIDEFQELFVEDDHVSQEASALLDRIVRQGRAFGMHAVLGSQTLGGAYTIARSTMGQMGVRIALQCNESDSQLILSDDNLAARLLARPGEAIYNDAGGLLEGNSPFQVVWLGDRERDERLDAVLRKAAPLARRQPLVVFEGTARASLDDCMPLQSARERARAGAADSLAPRVWLGEAVAIAEPTHITLQRRSGANTVVVSQDEEQAIAMGIAAIESLSAQCPNARLVLIDSTTPDLPTYGMLERCASAAGLEVHVARSSDAADALATVASTIAERESAQRVTDRAVMLMVHGAQRIRALRRNEDDYSFSSGDAPPSPDRVLAAIAREGPAHGVHAWIWVDNGASLSRTVDRSTLREFDWRVLFQCSAADSSALIDSGAASRLGPSRALLHDELSGRNEKFRPWALTGLSAPHA